MVTLQDIAALVQGHNVLMLEARIRAAKKLHETYPERDHLLCELGIAIDQRALYLEACNEAAPTDPDQPPPVSRHCPRSPDQIHEFRIDDDGRCAFCGETPESVAGGR